MSLAPLRLVALLLLSALALPARAQGTGVLTGHVRESDGVTAVIGANVRVDGTTLGAATDIDGVYRIIGVPVGVYSVTASYSGLASQTATVVQIVPGATRTIDFTLAMGALEEVVVTYEAPMITNDAIGQARVVTGDDLSGGSAPRRRAAASPAGTGTSTDLGVAQTVGLQGGAVNTEGSRGLNIRGGRASEVQYYVDGVRVQGTPSVSQQAIEQQDALIGTIPARYGDVQSGVLSMSGGAAPSVTDGEDYAAVDEVAFRRTAAAPLSTFSVDVDRASYANIRRMLTAGYLPPPAAVRVEEFVNAFELGMAGPEDGAPVAVHTEVSECPWAPTHRLVRIGVQSRRADLASLPPTNLVFLLDVSGSMQSADKLPLLKDAFRRLVAELRPQDRVAIVVYAGAAGLVLPPTSDKQAILDALGRLEAGGSTAGAQGIELAYQVARRTFDPAATNRVLLATDGDFNVGVTGEAALRTLVERERESGVMLSVFGLGTGNLQDARMEQLAAWGNGAYSYLDSPQEAERVFVRELGGTLVAVAKDVKVQVEFNPILVAGYRLVGYDNRRLADEDFANDARDAAEMGMGHHVTALYEVVLAGADEAALPPAEARRYSATATSASGEWLAVQLRYKPATGAGTFADESVLLTVPLAASTGAAALSEAPSNAMAWTSAVAEAALVLRHSAYAPGATLGGALVRARAAVGPDLDGDRAEFVRLLERAAALGDQQAQLQD